MYPVARLVRVTVGPRSERKADEARKRVARAKHRRKAKAILDDMALPVAAAVASGQ
jgi:hypothetical protein